RIPERAAAPASGSSDPNERRVQGEVARTYLPAPARGSGSAVPSPASPSSDGGFAQAPADRDTVRIERATLLESLHQSGDASEAWAPRATTLIGAVARYASATTPEGCFVAGCGATFAFASRGDYDRAIAEIVTTSDYQAWTGGKRWTA